MNYVRIGEVEIKKTKEVRAKPKQSADAIFTFMNKYEYLELALKEKMLSPRYCREDIRYLKLKDIKEVAIPMKCFCDIHLHKIHEHILWYGGYALSFPKQFTKDKRIQPIHYLEKKSELVKDLQTSLNAARKYDSYDNDNLQVKRMKNYLLHQLLFIKPTEGMTYHHTEEKNKRKYLMDEKEWRFVPDFNSMNKIGMKQVLIDSDQKNDDTLRLMSDALSGVKNCSIQFDYTDIKHIIVQTDSDARRLIDAIKGFDVDDETKCDLYTKIIIWDDLKGDL